MEHHQNLTSDKPTRRVPWNKGKIVGAKPPLQPSPPFSQGVRASRRSNG